MAARAMGFVPAFLLLSLCCTGFSQTFPAINDIVVANFQTEVQMTDVLEKASAYVTEYYDDIDQRGRVKIYFQGNEESIYYDNSTYQITEVNGSNCSAFDADTSEYDYNPIYYGWLNKDPIVVGPSAAFWYAQSRKGEAKYESTVDVRSIKCDKFTLAVKNERDDLTYEYFFATSKWTTPYNYKNLRVPIRIRISGKSSRLSADKNTFAPVEQINDFAYFKPSIDDPNKLLPPIGLGCKNMEKSDMMPEVPKMFQYSAEVVDLLGSTEHEDIEIQLEKTWYDHQRFLARRDISTRKNGFTSTLFDFNSGTLFKIADDGTCGMEILKDTDFQTYDYGMTSRMKDPKEVLNLDGDFYEMGKREIRGIRCDTFESVQFDKHFQGKKYAKLVVTVYFIESETNVGVAGEMESQIPVNYIITGYETLKKKTLQLQYNIFGFKDIVWPEMYSFFRLDRCYPRSATRAYFTLVLPVPAKFAADLEGKDEMIIRSLRRSLAENAKIHEMRIQFLKAAYKPTGVYITGAMLERPPTLLQFYELDSGPTVTKDPYIKVIVDAKNKEQCSSSCIDEGDFLCKGFYFCGQACFLKSTDPTDLEDNTSSNDLGECTEYIRSEIESSNFRQSYLIDALGYLKKAVSSKQVKVTVNIPDGEEIITATDLSIKSGPKSA